MSDFVKKAMSTQHVSRRKDQKNPNIRREVEVFQHDSKPSWKRYGKGCAIVRVSAAIDPEGIPHISINTSETALADEHLGPKRDTTKETFFTAYGPAALEIYEVLKEAFEPKVAAPKADEVGGAA